MLWRCFLLEADGGFGSHGLHLALKLVSYSSYVSMETDIGRGKYIRVLNNFNSYLLPPSIVVLKKKKSNPKADTSGIFIKLVQAPSHTVHFEIRNMRMARVRGVQGAPCSVGCPWTSW